jgi:hypothetical protein
VTGVTLLTLASPASAATPVGDTISVVREVTALEGRRRAVGVGQNVYQNDTITTARASQASLLFLDKTSLWIGGSATVKLDRFVYDPSGRRASVILSAFKGALQWVTGALPSRSYTINTPHISIGIRGTKFDVLVGRTESVVVVREGEVNVCPRRGGPCRTLDRPGAVALGNARGVDGPTSSRVRALDLPSLYQRLGAAALGVPGLPTQYGEVPGLPGVRLDAARHLPGPQLPSGSGSLLGGEANSIGGAISVVPGGIVTGNDVRSPMGSTVGGPSLRTPLSSPPAATGPTPAVPSLPALPSLPSVPRLTR